MDIEQLQLLIKNGESHTIEFKKSTTQLRPAFETICVFLNADGGFVMLGVNDNTRQEIAREISKLNYQPKLKLIMPLLKTIRQSSLFMLKKECMHRTPMMAAHFKRDQSVTTRMPQQRYDQLV